MSYEIEALRRIGKCETQDDATQALLDLLCQLGYSDIAAEYRDRCAQIRELSDAT